MNTRVKAILATAPLAVATVALAAAPLVGTLHRHAPAQQSHISAAGDECATTVQVNAFGTLKWPWCAGD